MKNDTCLSNKNYLLVKLQVNSNWNIVAKSQHKNKSDKKELTNYRKFWFKMPSRYQCRISQHSTKMLGKQRERICTIKMKTRNNSQPVVRVQEEHR